MIDISKVRHGYFRLQELKIWGELLLARSDTYLKLKAEGQHPKVSAPKVIYGQLHDFTLVTCIDCVGGESPALAYGSDGSNHSSWNLFPHQILTGHSHFNPDEDRIRKAWFSTGDMYRIFNDFDSFGTIWENSEQLCSLIPRKIGNRDVPIGPKPEFVYFAGRSKLLTSPLSFGNFEVQHWSLSNSDAQGAHITTEMRIQLEFQQAVTLKECLQKVASIAQFLSLVAGRSQGVENIQVQLEGHNDNEPPLSLHWSLGPQQTGGGKLDEPSWTDMPLDGVRRADEFSQVITRWFQSDNHALPRARLHSCRRNSNHFDVDRLVAAANLFDLTTTLKPVEVQKELSEVREKCLLALRALPNSDDRNSAILALSRIGEPTLMKKILSRAEIMQHHFILDDLDKVLRQAVKCRNYFVHGPGDKSFNISIAEHHKAFLTETLEFVFATAELIECGWAANAWRLRPHTGHHWFSRYISEYARLSKNLLSDLNRSRKSENTDQ